MMRLAGMFHTNRSASVLEHNICFSEHPEAKDSGTFQIFWGLQEAPVVLTFFGPHGIGIGVLSEVFYAPPIMIQLLLWSRYKRAAASVPSRHSECPLASKALSQLYL